MRRGRHRQRGWWSAARGRAEQGDGRHTVEHLRAPRAVYPGQPNADGLYPMGATGRAPDVGALDDRPDNDRYVTRETAAAS